MIRILDKPTDDEDDDDSTSAPSGSFLSDHTYVMEAPPSPPSACGGGV